MRNKVTFLNIIPSLIMQVSSIISGLVVSRLILSCFGSEVNGLVASLMQFLGYISLVEGAD